MPDNEPRQRRRSMRLRGYDYAQPGMYFVTLCTQDRQRLFGSLANATMQLNDAGQMIARWWGELGRRFPTIRTDAFVVMPDHLHGIIEIGVGAGGYINPPLRDDIYDTGAVALADVIQWLKVMTTTEYIRSVKHSGWPPFSRRVWQRGYYDHIVRDAEALDRIRRYIEANPQRCQGDHGTLDALIAHMQPHDEPPRSSRDLAG